MITTVAYVVQNWESLGNEFLRIFRKYPYFLAAIKGIRNGIVYGTRVRLPHALVMVFLFSDQPIMQKIATILRLTKTHAISLAKFTCCFRLLKELLMRLDGVEGDIPREWHSFIAAGIVGYFVFGENNQVNSQINMYLLSRITIGIVKLLVRKGTLPMPNFPAYPLYAAFCWAASLWLFEHYPDVLQGSLVQSMTYLHKDINHWTDIKTFMIKNK